jgi:hypothetical protein
MRLLPAALTTIALALLPIHAMAQDPAAEALTVELNAVEPADGGCKVTFLATNSLGADIDRTALELALFRTDGAIQRMVTLEFKALPQAKTKVLQFQIPALDCADLGRVLINDITACEGPDLAASACLDRLETRALSDLAFGV